MSRSAGRVLIIPKGEYNASTQYSMLDLVEYNGCGYVAKQATKGNLPTNDTYWQQMGTTGGGGDPSTYMLIDGSNAEILKFAGDQTHFIEHVDISKEAGENQTVVMTVNVKYNSTKGKLTTLIRCELGAHIGDENVIFYEPVQDDNPIEHHVVIDSVSVTTESYDTDDDVITARGHLVTDKTSAINLTNKNLVIGSYIASGVSRGLSFGNGNTLSSNLAFAGGRQSSAGGEAEAFGERCVAGTCAHAEGRETCATLEGHAEGRWTVAYGEGAHAEGTGTIAIFSNQHAMGAWNMPRYDAILMIGGGSPDDRSNIFEIYNDGSISFDNGTTKYKFAKVDGVNGFYDKNGTFHAMESTVLVKNNVTLSTSDTTTVTFTNSAIKSDSMLQVYTDVFGIDPIDVRASAGSCQVDFAQVESSTTIKVKLEIK